MHEQKFLENLRMSKITFDLGFRFKYFFMVQIYNYITSKFASKCVWGIYYNYVTSKTMSQSVVWKGQNGIPAKGIGKNTLKTP